MLKQITNISGVTQLTKKEQQKCKAGSLNDSYYCVGGSYLTGEPTCPSSHPYMHPQGHCLCCKNEWKSTLIIDE
jgi:hypothetical protein